MTFIFLLSFHKRALAFLLILLLQSYFFPVCTHAELHEGDVVTKNISGHVVPCHILPLRYADRFPAQKVLHPSLNPSLTADEKRGLITSERYLSARFLPISRFNEGDKFVSYIQYNSFDFDIKAEDEFSGFVRVDSTLVKEIYDDKIHGAWPLMTELDSHSGSAQRLPILKEELHSFHSGPTENSTIKLTFVYYEMCKIRSYIDARKYPDSDYNEYKSRYPNFPFEDTEDYWFPEDGPPTFQGYKWEQISKEDFDFNAFIAKAFIVGGSAIPVLGSAITLEECLQTNDPLCWASFGLDLTSDVIIVGRLVRATTLGAKLANAGSTTGKVCEVNKIMRRLEDSNTTLYAIGAGNITLGGFYAARGDYLNGLARIAAGAGDAVSAVLITKKGFVGGKVGKIPSNQCKEVQQLSLLTKITSLRSRLPADEVANAIKRAESKWPGSGEQAKALLDDLNLEITDDFFKRQVFETLEYASDWSTAVTGIRGLNDAFTTFGRSGVKDGSYMNFFNNLHPDLQERIIQTSGKIADDLDKNMRAFRIAGQRIDDKIAELKARGISCNAPGNEFDVWSFITDGNQRIEVLVGADKVFFSKTDWNLVNCAEIDAMNKWLNARPGRTLSSEKMMATLDSGTLNSKVRCENCQLNFPAEENLLLLEKCDVE